MGTTTIDVPTILSNILSGTNTTFATFEPLFVFLGGFLLAMIGIYWLVSMLTGRHVNMFSDDDIF